MGNELVSPPALRLKGALSGLRTKSVLAGVAAAVAMHGKISQLRLGAVPGDPSHKVSGQGPIPCISRYIVNPVPCQENLAGEQPNAITGLGNAGRHDGAMLVTVTWKQVGHQPIEMTLRHAECI